MGKHDQESAAVGARRATGAATGRGRGGRFSAGRKRETVLRLLRGEDLESVSRELGITAARASHWRDQFLAAGQAGLKSRAPNLNAYTARLRAHHQGILPRAPGPDRRGLAASRRPRVRRARPPRTESPGARPSPDPAAVDGTATPSSRPVPPAARWDVALLLSVSSVIHDRPSTPRSSFWTVRDRSRRRGRSRSRRRPGSSPAASAAPGSRPPRRSEGPFQ